MPNQPAPHRRRSNRTPDEPGKADLHIHSLASDGLNSPRAILDYVEEQTDLDVIAITDHDMIDGALEAQEICRRGHYSFDVVAGEEVSTLSGHLLALNIQTCVRMYQPLEKTIRDIRVQGGLVVIPHPLAWFSSGLRRWRIDSIMHQEEALHFDGLETFNPSFAGRKTYSEAIELGKHYHLAGLGGSDSHCLKTIGSARTRFAGRTWIELRQAIEQRQTQAEGEWWAMEDYTSIAVPQAFRSLIILPGKRIRKLAGWFLQDRGIIAADTE